MSKVHDLVIAALTEKLRTAKEDFAMHNDSLIELWDQHDSPHLYFPKDYIERERRAQGARDRAEDRIGRLWTAIQEVEAL